MITRLSIALAAYEAIALTTRRIPTVTTLSARRLIGLIVWAWWLWLGAHFLEERS